MAFTDPRLMENEPKPENTQDIIPPTERNQDPERTEISHGLTMDGARPLTAEERKAADLDTPAGERVYAPASERVPVKPVPGHRDFIEHPDTHTPEREAAGQATEPVEPAFTRVSRPTPAAEPYTPASTSPGWQGSPSYDADWNNSGRGSNGWFGMRAGWLTLGIGAGVGVWLWRRWQRARNTPMNRLRRQARHAADEIRERVPNAEEAARPAMGLTTAILSMLLLWWQQSQARAAQTNKMVSRRADKAAQRAKKAVRS
jgi:hypothetical protein